MALKNLLFTVTLLAVGLPAAAAPDGPLRMGVFPYHSPEQLVRLHKPLKDFLEAAAGQAIRLVSAPDFDRFIERTVEGRYGLIITAPHLGRSAQRSGRYHLLGFTRNRSRAVFVARIDSGLDGLEALTGKALALPPQQAIIHHVALNMLERSGLRAQSGLRLITKPSHDKALFAALRGETDAAAVGLPTWSRYPAPEKSELHIIGESESIPGFAVLLRADLPAGLGNRIRSALFRFESTPQGEAYFGATGLEGMRKPSAGDESQLDDYLERISTAGIP